MRCVLTRPPIKVLLVEDSLSDALLLQEQLATLAAERFEVTRVERLDEALERLGAVQFDVVLLDLSLPDSTGLDTFLAVRTGAPLIPLVVLTGLEDEVLALEAVRRGVQDYLVKGESDARQIARAIRYAVERSCTEAALRESETRFRLASEAAHALVYDVDLVAGRALSVQGLSRLLGYEPEERDQTMAWWFDQVHPEDLPVTEGVRRGLAHLERYSVQYRIRHRDGNFLHVEDNGSVVLDREGRAVRLVGGIVDVTLRKQAEQKLEDMRDDLERMVQERTADLRRVNQTLEIITDCNEAIARATRETDLLADICRIIVDRGGYRMAWVGLAEDDPAKTVRPVCHAGHEDGFLSLVRIGWGDDPFGAGPTGKAIRTGQPCIGRDFLSDEQLLPWRGEALRCGFRSTVALPLCANGRVFGNLTIYASEPDAFDDRQLVVLRDLSDDLAFGLTALRTRAERDRAQKELEQRSAELRLLAAELTHTEERERRRLAQAIHDELQQLLVAAKLCADTIRKQTEPPASATVDQMEELLKESISVARSLTFELSPPVLYDLGLARALEWLGRWIGSKHGLTVSVHASREADPDNEDLRVLLFQAARELLFNIVKHGAVRTAEVHLSRSGDNQVRVVVSDAGVGFDPEACLGEGSAQAGFGLFSIRGRLDLFGGRMEIESKPGRGSRVTLWAPMDSPARTPVQPRVAPVTGGVPAPAARAKIRVLLADDHMLIREGLRSLLQEHDDMETVGEAADGQAALEMARRLKPDVVLMDINMPRLNGIAATVQVMRELPATKVIGLSISDEPDLLEAMRDAGAVAFVSKAAAISTLVSTIRSCLSPAAR